MPPTNIGGLDNVLAILPEGSDLAHVAEDSQAVLLRLDTEDEVCVRAREKALGRVRVSGCASTGVGGGGFPCGAALIADRR